MVRRALILAAAAGFVGSDAARAADPDPVWMLGLSGGSLSREGDGTRAYESASLIRKLGKSYVRLSVTNFDSTVRQVDVTLPSSYTIGFLSAGTTFGHWYVDGYGAFGAQHYHAVITPIGPRDIQGSAHSGVFGAGGDAGYMKWLGNRWSVTPSASVQWIRSRALREQIGPTGPSEYETQETGATFGGTLRVDRFFGRDRATSFGLRVTHYITTNASAALGSGTRGALGVSAQSGRQADAWTDFGGNGSIRLSKRLYLDVGASRTVGALAGDVTTTSGGVRILF